MRALRLLLLACVALAAGCADQPASPNPQPGATATVRLSASVVGTPVATLAVTVTAADIAKPLTFNITARDGVAQGTLELQPGPARTITVQAMDARGEITHEGAKTVDIQRGRNPQLSITLQPRNGQVPITAVFGSVVVRVAPWGGEPDVVIGDTTEFYALAIDEVGTLFVARTARWATDNPGIATIDSATGKLAAYSVGRVRITATYQGYAGSFDLEVKPGRFTQVAAVTEAACGLTQRGYVYCWGNGSRGQLGVGTQTVSADPLLVAGGRRYRAISGGSDNFCAIGDDYAAYCWGENMLESMGTGTPSSTLQPSAVDGGVAFTSLSAGFHHCGIAKAGSTYCWGYAGDGALGIGATSDYVVKTPTQVAGGLSFVQVAVSPSRNSVLHACGLTAAGAAYCWGNNRDGKLGDNTTQSRSVPVPVAGGLVFKQLAPGGFHTCGLTTGGAAYCWGNNEVGQLGTGEGTPSSPVPVAVRGGRAYTSIVAGNSQTCALTEDGTAYCWGNNNQGQLGNGTWTGSSPEPVAVAGGLRFTRLTASMYNTFGIAKDGLLYGWGDNSSGQLGPDAPHPATNVPVRVAFNSIRARD